MPKFTLINLASHAAAEGLGCRSFGFCHLISIGVRTLVELSFSFHFVPVVLHVLVFQAVLSCVICFQLFLALRSFVCLPLSRFDVFPSFDFTNFVIHAFYCLCFLLIVLCMRWLYAFGCFVAHQLGEVKKRDELPSRRVWKCYQPR